MDSQKVSLKGVTYVNYKHWLIPGGNLLRESLTLTKPVILITKLRIAMNCDIVVPDRIPSVVSVFFPGSKRIHNNLWEFLKIDVVYHEN